MEERTPEIAIEYLEHYKKVKYGMMPEWVWDMAIKALGQEPILDKTKAEIARLRDSWEKDNYHDEADALTTALAIIDKYKAESENP